MLGAMKDGALHQRLAAVAGERTYRQLAELTRTHPETVRRYMQGQAPSVDFLAGLSGALGISGTWLLTGEGPMRTRDIRGEALRQADAGELLTAMSDSIATLIDRVDRLERFVQTMETRVRAAQASDTVPQTGVQPQGGHKDASQQDDAAEGNQSVDRRERTGYVATRARRIGRAISERSSEDAD